MINFDSVQVFTPTRSEIKVLPAQPSKRRLYSQDETRPERRYRSDRRKKPFRHRGQYEMRKGRDRRAQITVDETI